MPGGLAAIADRLASRVEELRFGRPVAFVYDPLVYARKTHHEYLDRYGGLGAGVLLLGMNPGPFGMAQTGVPFGDVEMVRDWLGIRGAVGRPPREHPRRPVEGFACRRREVSGSRLWGWARERFGRPEAFFRHFLVVNWCPLLFLERSGRNLPVDRLPAAARSSLAEACDDALRETVELLRPRLVVGIGRWAEERARRALAGAPVEIGGILHPSPASPLANRGWAGQAERQLRALGVLS